MVILDDVQGQNCLESRELSSSIHNARVISSAPVRPHVPHIVAALSGQKPGAVFALAQNTLRFTLEIIIKELPAER